MPRVVDVPLNTLIADLDGALRTLLRDELERHGFEGVEVAFDAPSKEWSGKLTNPTLDVFLYDLREAVERAGMTPSEQRGNGGAIVTPPPLRLELTYAVTAWTKDVEDEHRLLSQILAVLFSHPRLPESAMNGRADAARLREVEISVGRPREEKADFWTSVGGQYKVSIDLAAHVTIESGASFVRGPEVRTQTVRTQLADRPRGTMSELHRCGGVVRDGAGAPVADAWVALPDLGRWTASDGDGRFRLARVQAGNHRLLVRTAAGDEVERQIDVPGAPADLTVGARRKR
jgi:uncharacterized protein DUF4255/carboxypeptidase family protein